VPKRRWRCQRSLSSQEASSCCPTTILRLENATREETCRTWSGNDRALECCEALALLCYWWCAGLSTALSFSLPLQSHVLHKPQAEYPESPVVRGKVEKVGKVLSAKCSSHRHTDPRTLPLPAPGPDPDRGHIPHTTSPHPRRPRRSKSAAAAPDDTPHTAELHSPPPLSSS